MRMDKAPLGHFPTWATMASVLAPSGSIQGRWPGLDTVGRPIQQRLLWVQSEGWRLPVFNEIGAAVRDAEPLFTLEVR